MLRRQRFVRKFKHKCIRNLPMITVYDPRASNSSKHICVGSVHRRPYPYHCSSTNHNPNTCSLMVTLLRGTPPEPCAVKPLPHFLLQLHHIFVRLHRLQDLVGRHHRLADGGDRVDLELRVVAAAAAVAAARLRQQPLLHQPAAALLLQGLPAQPGRKLVNGQHEEVDEGARAAAAHRRALRRRPARYLSEPHAPPPIGGG